VKTTAVDLNDETSTLRLYLSMIINRERKTKKKTKLDVVVRVTTWYYHIIQWNILKKKKKQKDEYVWLTNDCVLLIISIL